MPLPALAAVAGLVAAAHLGRKGSAANVSTENKKRMIDLVKGGRVSDATALAMELGLDRLDLSDANLSGVDLTGANLAGAFLFRAFLFRANLSGANLSGADLTDATLRQANLTNANLSEANLKGASITDATGINIGPSRKFIGIPYYHTETKSPFAPGRTNLRRIP